MHKPHKKIVLGACASLLLFAPTAHAQLSGLVPAPVQYVVAPETPGPNQQVQIQAQGVGNFLGDATITWSNNGKVISKGVGLRDFSFTTGALGVESDIHVSIQSSSQGTLVHDFVFLPSVIELVWEADTSAPPLYRSKSLYSGGSSIKVVAYPIVIVRGSRLSASSIRYQWSVNDQSLSNQSGLGASTLTFKGDQLQTQEVVDVDAYFGNSKIGHGEVTIPAVKPAIVLYDRDPLRGVIWDAALPNALSLSVKEITVQAQPYFFANNSSVSYSWTLNGDEITGPESAQGILTLRQAGSGTGAATLGVTLQDNDTDKLVQAAQNAVQIVFGKSSGSSLFGI